MIAHHTSSTARYGRPYPAPKQPSTIVIRAGHSRLNIEFKPVIPLPPASTGPTDKCLRNSVQFTLSCHPPQVLLALLAAAVVIDLIAKRILVGAVRTLANRSSVSWDDALVSHNVFGRLVQVVPALIVFRWRYVCP